METREYTLTVSHSEVMHALSFTNSLSVEGEMSADDIPALAERLLKIVLDTVPEESSQN